MEDHRGELVCILAGYGLHSVLFKILLFPFTFVPTETEMNEFLATNPGFTSRIGPRFNFTDFSADLLALNAQELLSDARANIKFAANVQSTLQKSFAVVVGNTDFANCRGVRNFVQELLIYWDQQLAAKSKDPFYVDHVQLTAKLIEDCWKIFSAKLGIKDGNKANDEKLTKILRNLHLLDMLPKLRSQHITDAVILSDNFDVLHVLDQLKIGMLGDRWLLADAIKQARQEEKQPHIGN